MEEIIKKNILDAIHYILKFQHQKINEEDIEYADKEIIKYVDENYDFSNRDYRVIHYGTPMLASDKRMPEIVFRYYAICQDNLELLKKLEKENFKYVGEHHAVKFYVLDRQFSTKFKEKDFVKYVLKYNNVFEHFYGTLRGLDYHKREKYLRDFSEVVKNDPSVLKVGDSNNSNFLTRRNLELFGKDYLMSISDSQRELINTFYFQINEENAPKIKLLLEKYPNFEMRLPLYRDVFEYFTVDELGLMNDKDTRLYTLAFQNNIIERVKSLLDSNPLFDCPDKFIREEIFRVIDNDTILDLSYEAIVEISRIKSPEIEKVLVFPVLKINQIVSKDKKKRKKEASEERHRNK